MQAYWARNAAAGLDYVLQHRWKARPAASPVRSKVPGSCAIAKQP